MRIFAYLALIGGGYVMGLDYYWWGLACAILFIIGLAVLDQRDGV